jgi:hypothetical protein
MSHTVAEENLSGRGDRDVWEAAQRDERFLITQDFGFLRRKTGASLPPWRVLQGASYHRASRAHGLSATLPTLRKGREGWATRLASAEQSLT